MPVSRLIRTISVRGGLGGPGGFRGGDGAYQLVNFAGRGGAGLGPGGGAGGNDNYFNNGHGAAATFLGAPDLLPLVGGSGGGGGASTNTAPNCGGGGGGGGGGALLIAANGTITINGQLLADGGNMGTMSQHSCASGGGPASGGAIRLLATNIAGSGNIFARGGSNVFTGARAQSGSIRMEALNNTMNVSATDPLAARAAGAWSNRQPGHPHGCHHRGSRSSCFCRTTRLIRRDRSGACRAR